MGKLGSVSRMDVLIGQPHRFVWFLKAFRIKDHENEALVIKVRVMSAENTMAWMMFVFVCLCRTE